MTILRDCEALCDSGTLGPFFLSRGSDERSEDHAATQNGARLAFNRKKKQNGENLCKFECHCACAEKSLVENLNSPLGTEARCMPNLLTIFRVDE